MTFLRLSTICLAAIVGLLAAGPVSAEDVPPWLLPTIATDDGNRMAGNEASRNTCVAGFDRFRDDGYFGYPVDRIQVINATWDQPTADRDRDLADQPLGPGGFDVVVNGTFFKKNAAGRYIPVGPVVRHSRLDRHDYPDASQRRGGVAVLDDGAIVVGRSDGLNLDDINRRFAGDGRTVEQFMGGGALLIEDGARVSSDDLADVQQFTNDGRGFDASQFRPTSHVVVAVRDGQVYVIVSERKSGLDLQDDLIANGFGAAVMFDGGNQTYLADHGQDGAGTTTHYGRDNYTGLGITVRRIASSAAAAGCGERDDFCVGAAACGTGATGAEAVCRQYARSAVAANEENLNLECRYGGAAWGSDFDGHYNWCIGGVADQVLQRETQARADAIADCARRKALCTPYAQTAVAQNERNLALECGYGGGAWGSDYDGHYNWCFSGVAEDRVQGETQMREDAVADCARRKTECTRYANTAAAQNDRNLAMDCGFGGAPWQSDFDPHYNWCFGGVSLDRQNAENAMREAALENCRKQKSE